MDQVLGQSYWNGLTLCGSLIVAIGAQNAYLLAQSLRREHHLAIAALCILFDAILITAGVAGAATLATHWSWLPEVLRWAGVAFLMGYGLQAGYRALFQQEGLNDLSASPVSLASALATTTAVTWLNPHVYLDTLLLMGSVGVQQAQPGHFVGGAITASASWFMLLSLGGAALAPWLQRAVVWRAIDALVAITMLSMAVRLLWSA